MKQTSVSGVFEVSAAPDNGVSSFKSMVFMRSNDTPSRPTGGSYANPIPDGGLWSDGIPSGDAKLWVSSRIFTSDGKSPQQDAWTDPQPMSSTSEFEIQYSTMHQPSGNPTEYPDEWSKTGGEDVWWIATRSMKDGVWTDWVTSKVVGENAKYYVIEANVATIHRGESGYSPYLITVGEYYIDGALRETPNKYYIHVYGVKDGDETHLVYTGAAVEWVFNASVYYESDYDCFRFKLQETSSPSSDEMALSTTVSVSRDGAKGDKGDKGDTGSKGYSGARMRMRDWEEWTDYMSGADGEEWYDVVKYNGLLYLCTYSHNSETVTPQQHVASHTGRWEEAKEWAFIATELLLADRIKSDMIDTDDLIAKRIYTTSETQQEETDTLAEGEETTPTENLAHIEIAGSEMKVFNPDGKMNIRFGVIKKTVKRKDEEGNLVDVDEWFAVLEYYDNDGRKLYDLGPDGITSIPVDEESWSTHYYEYLGTDLANVLYGMEYKTKIYSIENKVYQYHSKIVAGVVDDTENDGRFFTAQAKLDTNILPNGIYRIAATSAAGNNLFASVDPSVIETALMDGASELDATYLPGFVTGVNELIRVQNPVYYESLYECVDGRFTKLENRAYWNGKPVASGS